MKKILYGLVGLIVLLLVVLIVAMFSLKSIVTPGFVVKQIESALNCRAELKQVNIGLFSAVSSVGLEGLKIGPRDDLANKGVPLKERPELKNELLGMEKANVAIKFGSLLAGKVELKEFLLTGVKARVVSYENGTNNLSPLFQPPKIVNGEPNPALTQKKEPEKKEEAKAAEQGDKKPFSIKSLPVSASLNKIGLKSADISVHIQKTNTTISLAPMDLIIQSIDIDPSDLENHDSIHIDLHLPVVVATQRDPKSVNLVLDSNTDVVPFDKKTGYVNPNLLVSLTARKDSSISGFAMFDQLAGALPALEKIGFSMPSLKKRAVITEDANVQVEYGAGKVSFVKDALFRTQSYALSLEKKSWIKLSDNTHNFTGSLLANKQESANAVQGIDSFLKKQAPNQDPKEIRKTLLADLIKDDQINLKFKSTGPIKNPNVQLTVPSPDLKSLLKGAVKGALKDAASKELKKLGGPEADAAKKALDKLF